MSATRPHKLASCSLQCVFLGYPLNQRGYCCLDVTTGKIYVSRHVTFDENVFPFACPSRTPSRPYDFLDTTTDTHNPLLYDAIATPNLGHQPSDSPSAQPHTPANSPTSAHRPTPSPVRTLVRTPEQQPPTPTTTSAPQHQTPNTPVNTPASATTTSDPKHPR